MSSNNRYMEENKINSYSQIWTIKNDHYFLQLSIFTSVG